MPPNNSSIPAAAPAAAHRELVTRHSSLVTMALAAAVALTTTFAKAGIPRPMLMYYGQACDRFGQVYKSGADIFLLRGTQEVARTTIAGAIAPGVNFRLSVPYDSDPTDANYVAYAVNAGDELTVWVTDSAGTRQVESCTVPPVGAPGEAVALRIIAGEDADSDGMSDAWERANGLDPSDPSDALSDLDGDGQSNLDEYRSGTLPWLGSDRFGTTALTTTPGGMYALTFPTTYGKLYTVQTAPLALDETGGFAWTSCPFALEDATTPTQTRLQGTGSPVTIYLDTSALNGLWRLSIQ